MENLAYEEEYEDEKVEIIDGVEYAMAPARIEHITAAFNLGRIIGNFLHKKRCRVFLEPAVHFGEDMLVPDLVVVCDPSKINLSYIDGAPDFVVEVLSRSTEKRDKTTKFQIYEKYGVKEYWIVDTWGKSITVYKLNNDKFVLTKIYWLPREEELKYMTEKEKDSLQLKLKLSLYDDLEFDISEVFEDI